MVIAQVRAGEAPPQVVLDIARRLEQGEVLLLPTDTVYGLHALARNAAAVERMRRIKQLPERRPLVNLYSSAVGLGKYVILPEGAARRRILDDWPGSVTWVLPATENVPKHILGDDNTLGVRIPDNQLIRSVCSALDDLVVSTSANRHGQPPASLRGGLDPEILAQVDGSVFQVEALPGQPSEVKRWTPAGPVVIRSREGSGAGSETRNVLLVCSGNICRSPMAEALLREKLTRGGGGRFIVRSAGTIAVNGQPPQLHAIQVMDERGMDIRFHRSRELNHELIDWADIVLVMTTDHLGDLHERYPESTQKLFLFSAYPSMDVEGLYGIEDPYGSGLEGYRATAVQIESEAGRIVEHLLARSGLRPDPEGA